MRFNKLTSADIETIKGIYYDGLSWKDRMSQLCHFTGKGERANLNMIKWLGLKKTENENIEIKKPEEIIEIEQIAHIDLAKQRVFDKDKKRFIITSAQAETEIHPKFWENIKAYANYIDASIHVIALRYKSPTSLQASARVKKQEYWVDELVPYLDANRHNIHKNLCIMADVKIQMTASKPLNGLQGMTGSLSCIVGSPKMQLQYVPVLDSSKPKIMATTGSVTVMNYTDTKIGKQSEFHHVFGFVVVEIDDEEIFHSRQVFANSDGSFTDLYYNVSGCEISEIKDCEALILGDIHAQNRDDVAIDSTMRLMAEIHPKNVLLHDLFDGVSVNPHELKNPIVNYQNKKNKITLHNEVVGMLDFLQTLNSYNVIVVNSNHDDFLNRYIINADWKGDIENAYEYIEYCKVLLEDKAPKGLIAYIIDKNMPNIRTLGIDESFLVKDFQLAIHGSIGQNGSRGSINQYKNLSQKIVVGHSHSSARLDGVVQVGCLCKLRQSYNKGTSSWNHSNAIIHSDGKCQQIHIMNGRYTTFKTKAKINGIKSEILDFDFDDETIHFDSQGNLI